VREEVQVLVSIQLLVRWLENKRGATDAQHRAWSQRRSARQLRPTYLTSSLKQVLTNGKKRSFSVCIEWSASKEASMFT